MLVREVLRNLLLLTLLLTGALCFDRSQPEERNTSGACLLQRSTQVAALHLSAQDSDLPDPRQKAADAMIEKFRGIIEELGVQVIQCGEGIEKLRGMLSEKPYVINAMVPFVGDKARSCNLKLPGLTVHLHPPAKNTPTCVLYCGESDCPAALTYITNAKSKLQKQCGSIVYLQGGALCFTEHNVPVASRGKCLGIVAPHGEDEFRALADELSMKELGCDEAAQKLSDAGTGGTYVLNVMLPVFGEKAQGCNLANIPVHDDVPEEQQDECVLYCGEARCPIALSFMQTKKKRLRAACKSLSFVRGGASCFLQKKVPLKHAESCRNLVAPEPEQ